MESSVTKVFPTPYQEFIYKRTYARWIEDEGRREDWLETVIRYYDFFEKRIPIYNMQSQITYKYINEFTEAMQLVFELNVMPSMRALWTAGPALDRENICGYNCAYTVIDRVKSFAEILYILMNGTGVGFSTERQYINQLPEVPARLERIPHTIKVRDSRRGWAEGLLELLSLLYRGYIPAYDLSKLRPKGAKLKTFGGRSSGPAPLDHLFKFTLETFKQAQGRKLNSLECYDLVTTIASIVIAGGVRRSATINLSNFSDQRMARAKEGQFWLEHPNRALSNNSVAYTEKPDMNAFMSEWFNLAKSGTGERGIINREGLRKHIEDNVQRRDPKHEWGVNPCGEVVLRPRQFCNLTEVVVRPYDSLEALIPKVKAATILGVLQSTLTDFTFLDEEWKKNVEEERLLGVSLTGLQDNEYLCRADRQATSILNTLKETAKETAKEWSEALGIPMPAAITSIKPSGTVSQLVDSASGLHARYAPYYVRRVRVAYSDPLTKLLMSEGVPCSPEVGETWDNCTSVVFAFPQKAPEICTNFRYSKTAVEQLEYWKMLKLSWCEHNPSITVYVQPHEWLEVGAWVYRHWDIVSGITFLPADGGIYQLAPYEEITEEEYKRLKADMPSTIDFAKLAKYEKKDATEGSREYACVGGACEI